MPKNLMVSYSTMDSCEDNAPVNEHKTWQEVCNWLRRSGQHGEKKDGLSISPCTYGGDGRRTRANVEAMHLLVLDIDYGVMDPIAWLDTHVPFQFFAWSSWNDGVTAGKYTTDDGARFRVMVPLSQPVPPELLYAFAQEIGETFPDADAQVVANSNSLYFTPRMQNGQSCRMPWTRHMIGDCYQVSIPGLEKRLVDIERKRQESIKRQRKAAIDSAGKVTNKRIQGVLASIYNSMADSAPGHRQRTVVASSKQIYRLDMQYRFGSQGPIDVLKCVAIANMGQLRTRDVERGCESGRRYAEIAGPEALEERAMSKALDAQADETGIEAGILMRLPKAPCSAEHSMPSSYRIAEFGGGILRTVIKDAGTEKEKEITLDVCNAPIIITRKLVDDDGVVYLVVAWKGHKGWTEARIAREDIASARKLIGLAAHGAPVTSSRAKLMVDYFEAYEHHNAAVLPTSKMVSRMGWHGESFVLGEHVITDGEYTEQSLDSICLDIERLDKPVVQAYHQLGTFAGWRRAIAPLVEFPLVMSMLCASLSSVLLEPTGTPGFAFDMSWHTSTGKSSAMDLCASAFGKPGIHGLRQDWQASTTYIERMSAAMRSLPYFADDTKTCANKQSVGQILYSFVSRGRGRGTVTGVQETVQRLGVLISTGEQAAVKYTNDDGAAARTITVQGLPFGAENSKTGEIIELALSGARQHYGHAVVEFVWWIMGMERHKLMDMVFGYQQTFDGLSTNGKGRRKAQSFALMSIVREWLELQGVIWHQERLEEVFISCHEEDKAKSDVAHSLLTRWAVTNLDKFHGGRTKIAPTKDGWCGTQVMTKNLRGEEVLTELCVKEEVAKEVLLSQDMWEENLPKIWADTGKTLGGKDRSTVRRRMGGGSRIALLSLDLSGHVVV